MKNTRRPVRRSLPRRAAACPVVASHEFRRKQSVVGLALDALRARMNRDECMELARKHPYRRPGDVHFVGLARAWNWLLVKHLLDVSKQRDLWERP